LHTVSAFEAHAVVTVACDGHTVHLEQTVFAVFVHADAWNSSSAQVAHAVH
jgi:hypothetical protein